MKSYQWAIIGAGPAGIAAVGNLLDHGIDAQQILWVDPEFNVGDFGTKWKNVSSNTKAGLFVKYLEACHSFDFNNRPKKFELEDLDPNDTCQLSYMAEPLHWVTEKLINTVTIEKTTLKQLTPHQQQWLGETENDSFIASNVVLAVGAHAKYLPQIEAPMIALDDALDKNKLAQQCSAKDTVAVFGSSHSAVMIVRDLLELGVNKVINFYQSPLRYAVFLDDWILYDNTGLKGRTAQWAKENLHGNEPENLLRCLSSQENIAHYLPECTKTIHAVGFDPREVYIPEFGQLQHDDKTGIIAPGLFGVGIAYPEAKINPLGNTEYNVGLWKFMDYIKRVMPIWLAYGS